MVLGLEQEQSVVTTRDAKDATAFTNWLDVVSLDQEISSLIPVELHKDLVFDIKGSEVGVVSLGAATMDFVTGMDYEVFAKELMRRHSLGDDMSTIGILIIQRVSQTTWEHDYRDLESGKSYLQNYNKLDELVKEQYGVGSIVALLGNLVRVRGDIMTLTFVK